MNRGRFVIVAGVLLIVAVAVVARATRVMLFEHDHWSELAVRQQQRTVSAHGRRGSILSSDGYVLATSLESVALQIDTHVLPYPSLFASAAADVLDLDADDVERRLTSGPRAVWLAQQVDPKTAEEVRILAPSAVVMVPDSSRVYPLAEVAAPVIGFVGREELATVGRSGFEYSFNDDLTGTPGRYLVLRDAVQRHIRLQMLESGNSGVDLELTLSAQLQARCEAVLNEVLSEVGGESASAVVVEVATGAVRALVSLPSFDPAAPGAEPDRWRLRPVQDAVEPGSTVKPFIAALGLAHDVIREGERFDCRHRGTEVAGRWIRDHAEPGLYTLHEVIVHSANVGVIEIAHRLDPERLFEGFELFGLGRRTLIGYPAEATGLMQGVDSWSKLSPAGFALGQELTVSPLQMAMAYAAIANDGWMLRPQLVHEEGVRQAPKRILSGELSRRLKVMLEAVVTDGTGSAAQIDGIRVAGKTGTAQRAVLGGFDDDHHAAWFAGFLPMPSPRYAVVVLVDEPEESYWASSVAAPAFARIAEAVVEVTGMVREPSLGGGA